MTEKDVCSGRASGWRFLLFVASFAAAMALVAGLSPLALASPLTYTFSDTWGTTGGCNDPFRSAFDVNGNGAWDPGVDFKGTFDLPGDRPVCGRVP